MNDYLAKALGHTTNRDEFLKSLNGRDAFHMCNPYQGIKEELICLINFYLERLNKDGHSDAVQHYRNRACRGISEHLLGCSLGLILPAETQYIWDFDLNKFAGDIEYDEK